MNITRNIALFLLAILACLSVASCREPDPIRIGFFGGITGRAAGLGTSGRNGFLLAIEQSNAAGGIHGRKIEPVIGDHRMDPDAAKTTLRDLLDRQVEAVIGPMTSQVAVTVVPEVNRAQVPMISPTASTNQLSGLDDYFLRVYYSNSQAAALLANYLGTRHRLPRMLAIYDLNNRAYTEDWVSDFGLRYSEKGGRLIDRIPFDVKEDLRFGALVDKAIAREPDAILILANAVDTALIAQQISKRGLHIPLYATGWSYTDDLLQFGGKSVEGLTIIQSANPDASYPQSLSFRQAYRERYGESPNFPALHAYDATRILLSAYEQSGAGGEKLKRALLDLPPRAGVQGAIAFDRFGDLRDPELHLATISQGVFRPLP